MRRTPLRRTALKRGRKRTWHPKHDPQHDAATALALRSHCLLCESKGSCVPAHFPRHRGSGGKWPNPWDRSLWVPLCSEVRDEAMGSCHSYIDGHTGGQNPDDCERRERARKLVMERARETWWSVDHLEARESPKLRCGLIDHYNCRTCPERETCPDEEGRIAEATDA